MLPRLSRLAPGGVLDQYLGRAEGLKPRPLILVPCFRPNALFIISTDSYKSCTLFRTDSREIVYPVLDRLVRNYVPYIGQTGRKPYPVQRHIPVYAKKGSTPTSGPWGLAASPLACLGFACSNFAKQNKRLLAVAV